MSYPSTPNFLKHTENLQAVAASLKQIERAHKRAIRENDQPAEFSFRVVHTLLLGVYAEARLRKIIEDPTGFNRRERELIWAARSQSDRWVSAVEFAARRHYRVLAHSELEEVLPVDAMARVGAVIAVLQDELAPVITDRNRLAHGQWVWQLRSGSEDQFAQHQSTYDYNYSALRARFRLLDSIGQLVHILCVSEPTFGRDFDALTQRITAVRGELDGSGYPELVAQLRKSRATLRDS